MKVAITLLLLVVTLNGCATNKPKAKDVEIISSVTIVITEDMIKNTKKGK